MSAASSSSSSSGPFTFSRLEAPDRLLTQLASWGITEDRLARMPIDIWRFFVKESYIAQSDPLFVINVEEAMIERDRLAPPSSLPARKPAKTWEELYTHHPTLKTEGPSPTERAALEYLRITPELLAKFENSKTCFPFIPTLLVNLPQFLALWHAISIEKQIAETKPVQESKEPKESIETLDVLFEKHQLDRDLLHVLKAQGFTLSTLLKMNLKTWIEDDGVFPRENIPLGSVAACFLAVQAEKSNIPEEKIVIKETKGLEKFNAKEVRDYKEFFEKHRLRIPFESTVSDLLSRGIHLKNLRGLSDSQSDIRDILSGASGYLDMFLALKQEREMEISKGFRTLQMLHRLEDAAVENLLSPGSVIQALAEYLDVPDKITPKMQQEMVRDSYKEGFQALHKLLDLKEAAIMNLLAPTSVIQPLAEYLGVAKSEFITPRRVRKMIRGMPSDEKKEIQSFIPLVKSVEDFEHRYDLTLSEIWKQTLQRLLDNKAQPFSLFNLSSFKNFKTQFKSLADHTKLISDNPSVFPDAIYFSDEELKSHMKSFELPESQLLTLYNGLKEEDRLAFHNENTKMVQNWNAKNEAAINARKKATASASSSSSSSTMLFKKDESKSEEAPKSPAKKGPL